jgi:hypothetical protein
MKSNKYPSVLTRKTDLTPSIPLSTNREGEANPRSAPLSIGGEGLGVRSAWCVRPQNFVIFMLILAALACTSNDTLFIQLTATPIPTVTPTRAAIQTRFAPGDKLTYVAATNPGVLLNTPDMNDKSTALCFTGTQITVNDATTQDKTTFYKIKCASSEGWTPESTLTPLRVNSAATLAQAAALTTDPEPDATTNRAGNCPNGSSVTVLDLAISPLDGRIYANVQCSTVVGWLPERSLSVPK